MATETTKLIDKKLVAEVAHGSLYLSIERGRLIIRGDFPPNGMRLVVLPAATNAVEIGYEKCDQP